MGSLMRSLIHLQQTEMKLREARAKLKNSQKIILRQEHIIKQHQAAVAAKTEEIKLTRLQSGKLELALKTEEDEIAKLRVALNSAKTNKEYSTILTRLNTDKADKSKLEEQILTLMNQVEADQLECRGAETAMQQDQQRLDEIRSECEEQQAKIQTEIDRLNSNCRQAADEVPSKERDMFTRLADRFEGEVLVEVAKTSRKDEHTCGGCYMSIPLERVNALMTKDEIVACPSCGRLLALDLNPAEQTA
jgi:hypothetical protein